MSMSQIVKIRRMKLEDLLEVIRVCNQAFIESARVTQYIGPQLVRSLIEEPEAQLVAEVDNKVVGFLRGKFDFKTKRAVIAHIAVHPEYQGRGIGKKLVEYFENIAASKGLNKVILGTPFAKGFYEKLGYKCVKTTYAVLYSLVGREVIKPEVRGFKILDPIELNHITVVVKSLEKDEAYRFLTHYFDMYKARYKLSALVISGDEVKGIIIGKEHEWIKDLLTITYLYSSSLKMKLWLLKLAAYKASLLGLRYLGIRTDDFSLVEELLKEGWEVKSLDTFWTGYTMEKEIKLNKCDTTNA